ncbi:MAG: hypothetical protein ACRDL5_00970, partial [Solirubrobacteraceae bacterium]
VAGNRGSSITYSVDAHGNLRGHVVEGLGWVRADNGTVTRYRPGQTYLLGAAGPPKLTYAWPVADRALVPAADLEATAKLVCTVPRLKSLSLTAARKRLKQAGCATGKVRRPRRVAKHARLVVHAATPPTGTIAGKHTRIALTLVAGQAEHHR